MSRKGVPTSGVPSARATWPGRTLLVFDLGITLASFSSSFPSFSRSPRRRVPRKRLTLSKGAPTTGGLSARATGPCPAPSPVLTTATGKCRAPSVLRAPPSDVQSQISGVHRGCDWGIRVPGPRSRCLQVQYCTLPCTCRTVLLSCSCCSFRYADVQARGKVKLAVTSKGGELRSAGAGFMLREMLMQGLL